MDPGTFLTRSFLSLATCTVAMTVIFYLSTTRISNVHSAELGVSIFLKPTTAISQQLAPLDNTLWQRNRKSYAHKRNALTVNDSNTTPDMFVLKYVYKGNAHWQKLEKLPAHIRDIMSTTSGTANTLWSPNEHSENEYNVPPLPKTLPYAAYLKSTDDIQKALWTRQLYKFLKDLNPSISPHVNMVFGDSSHTELVLNWIIAAHVRLDPPLHNILVLSVDQPLCDFLASKKLPFACIAVPPESFLASTGPDSYDQGIKSRFIVLRVMNFWGYDVASYDCDAVIRRNPQHLYDSHPNVQVFAGSSYNPPASPHIWGFSICGGTLFVRSHPSTENVWNNIHNSTRDECEQCLWNHAMQDMGVRWNVTVELHKMCRVNSGWQSSEPLSSIVFPQSIFCRTCCRRRSLQNYYVVHRSNEHLDTSLKHQKLKEMKSWFLHDDWWDQVSSSLEGNLWLVSIYRVYKDIIV